MVNGHRRALLVLGIVAILQPGCNDTSFYTEKLDGRRDLARESGAPYDLPASKLPDGYKLYGCTKAGLSCNAHDPCAVNPVCGPDLKCRPTFLQDCNDNLPCTLDTCLGSGMCSNKPKDGTCRLQVVVPKGVTCSQLFQEAGVPPLDSGVADDAGVTPSQMTSISCCSRLVYQSDLYAVQAGALSSESSGNLGLIEMKYKP